MRCITAPAASGTGDGVLQKPGEGERDYRAALTADVERAKSELEDGSDVPLIAVAFPYGLWSRTAVQQFRQAGIKLTFTTHYGCSRVRQGKAGSMQVLEPLVDRGRHHRSAAGRGPGEMNRAPGRVPRRVLKICEKPPLSY